MSWFPAPELQGDIHFVLMKSMPYRLRMFAIVVVMLLGVALEMMVNYWLGLAVLFFGTLMGMIRGYRAKPKMKRGETWSRVTPDEFKKIKEKEKQLKKWDRDAFDITNGLGCLVLFLSILGFCLLFYVTFRLFDNRIAGYVMLNGAVVLFPHWITGVRTYLKKDSLILKIRHLEHIMKALSANSEVQVQPMLSVEKTQDGKDIPKDARLMIRLLNAPEGFMGIQVQISINNVQGTDYPYLYCVLLARSENRIFDTATTRSPSRKVVVERSSSEGTDIVVVRQKTTKNSGYHTTKPASLFVVAAALGLAREYAGDSNS
ncbi:hypothetical protein JW948_13570 [bacterium]|nr:hypothetical protein [bacterium]